MSRSLPHAEVSASRGELARAALALGIVTFLLNANALNAFFVGDDFDFLRRMERLDGLADTVRFSFWGEWEPVWWASWYVDYALWGARPLGFHLTNVFWSSVCAFGVFAVLRSAWPRSAFAAWAAALLFATDPLHDEAVTYLAARGHPMATGLALLALAVWLRAENVSRRQARLLRIGLALVLACLAALAKETVLVLPLWAAALAGLRARAWRPALQAGALLAAPMLASLALRAALVGVGSDKLTGGLEDPGGLLAALTDQLPRYVLLGWLPYVTTFANEVTLQRAAPWGWALLLGLVGTVVVWGTRRPRNETAEGAGALEAYVFGLAVFFVSLGPLLWADLGLRRRYLFTPSVGVAIGTAALLLVLHRRAPRVAAIALAALVLPGAVETWHRNALYTESGAVAKRTLETLRRAPLEIDPAPEALEDVALLTLPRAYGGDGLSGAYLFHQTDLRSGLAYYGAAARDLHYALKCYYADDYRAEASFEGRLALALRVRFRHRRAFDDAAARDASEDRFGELLFAERLAADPAARTIDYRVHLRPDFWERSTLFLYSDGELIELRPPETPAVDLGDL